MSFPNDSMLELCHRHLLLATDLISISIFCNVVTEATEVADILAQYGLEPNEYWPVVNALRKRPEAWLEFMMRLVTTYLSCYKDMGVRFYLIHDEVSNHLPCCYFMGLPSSCLCLVVYFVSTKIIFL